MFIVLRNIESTSNRT